MKLEPRHLAPYSPYELKLKLRNDIIELHGLLCQEERIISYDIDNKLNECEMLLIKPIFHPLSDLVKEIKINEKKFVPFNEIYEEATTYHWCNHIRTLIEFPEKVRGMWPQYLLEKLFEWHFDVFRLIPEGLAIDINTLKEGKVC